MSLEYDWLTERRDRLNTWPVTGQPYQLHDSLTDTSNDIKQEHGSHHPGQDDPIHDINDSRHFHAISFDHHSKIQHSGRQIKHGGGAVDVVDLRKLAAEENGRMDAEDIQDAVASVRRKSFSRKNAWGERSYADLIIAAIEGSPEKRLTLSEIYDWIIKNVEYFHDKTDSVKSAGWKNSIRHNLSLHSRFVRIINETAGKSSWWTVREESSPRQVTRRRSNTMDPSVSYDKRFRTRRIKEMYSKSFYPHATPDFDCSDGSSRYGVQSNDEAIAPNHFPVIVRSGTGATDQAHLDYKERVLDHSVTDSTSEIIGNNLFPSNHFEIGDGCVNYTHDDFKQIKHEDACISATAGHDTYQKASPGVPSLRTATSVGGNTEKNIGAASEHNSVQTSCIARSSETKRMEDFSRDVSLLTTSSSSSVRRCDPLSGTSSSDRGKFSLCQLISGAPSSSNYSYTDNMLTTAWTQ